MKRLQKLNGWRRLWIVIAALSFLYTLGYSFLFLKRPEQYQIDYKILLAFEKPECKYIVDMPAGYKLEREPDYENPCRDLYLYRSIYEDAKNTREGYVHHMDSMQNILILKTTGIMLVVWLFGIGLLYASGVIVAWVVKGFRSNPTA